MLLPSFKLSIRLLNNLPLSDRPIVSRVSGLAKYWDEFNEAVWLFCKCENSIDTFYASWENHN
jgi:hypothetical protein